MKKYVFIMLTLFLVSCYGPVNKDDDMVEVPVPDDKEDVGNVDEYSVDTDACQNDDVDGPDTETVPDQGYISDEELFDEENSEIYSGNRRLSVGKYIAAAIMDGKVYTWGEWHKGVYQYGERFDVDYAPVEIDFTGLIDREEPVSVSAGAEHACVLFSNGKVFCWGNNHRGQLGDGTFEDSLWSPREVDTSFELRAKKVIDVACGTYHTCVVADDNDVYCWGDGTYGQLGKVDENNIPQPKKLYSDLLDGKEIVRIEAGSAYNCVLDTEGMLYCWGQLYLGEQVDEEVPYMIGKKWGLDSRKIVNFSCGPDFVCVIDSRYRIFCLGRDNVSMKLGVRSFDEDINFAEVTREDDFRTMKPLRIESGNDFSCVNDDDDNMYCWGYKPTCLFLGEVKVYETLPEIIRGYYSIDVNIAEISTGYSSVCLMSDQDEVYCWGDNAMSVLGNGTDMEESCSQLKTAQDKSVKNKSFTNISVNERTTYAINEDLELFSWGKSGQLNLYSGESYNYMVPFKKRDEWKDFSQNIVKVSEGKSHACLLNDNGNVYCWGDNDLGQLGTGDNIKSSEPEIVSQEGVMKEAKIVDISLGSDHSCALDSKGKVYCWGNNNYGQLGVGPADRKFYPTEIDMSDALYNRTVVSLKSGDESVCVLDQIGDAFCWGRNNKGQLGNGTEEDSDTPVKVYDKGVLAGKVLKTLDLYSGHACAVDDDGGVYCWGSNYSKQLGNGTIENSSVPVRAVSIDMPEDVRNVMVSVGWAHTCSVDEDSNIYCWGLIKLGEEEELDIVNDLPVMIDKGDASGKAVYQIDSGFYYNCLIDEEGKVYCWGKNSNGQLGDSSDIFRDFPVMVY